MKRLLSLCLGTLILGLSSAHAASPFVATPEAFAWNGLYFGMNGGGAWGQSRWSAGHVTTGDFDVSGGLGGVTVGHNFQTGAWVWGLEGDFDWMGVEGTTKSNCPPGCKTSSDMLVTGRARLGFAADRFLIYATGGLAAGTISASFLNPVTGTDSDWNLGWTAGGGVEYAVNQRWSVKAEYLYVDLGHGNCSPSVCSGPGVKSAIDFIAQIVRVGLNYRF